MNIKNRFSKKETINKNFFENGPVQKFLEGKKEEKSDIYKILYLDEKIKLFINWWKNNLEGIYPIDYTERRLRILVEDVVMFYESIYPDDLVNEAIKKGKKNHINQLMNDYLNKQDAELLLEPSYPKYVTLSLIENNGINGNIRIYLTKDGIVENMSNSFSFNNTFFKKDFFNGKDINKVLEILKRYHKETYAQTINIVSSITEYNNKIIFKNMLLDTIMYRIIESGNVNFGAKRAYLFACEFKRNKDMPISYGAYMSDPYLNDFIEEYLKNGGNSQLLCFVNYKTCVKENRELDIEYLDNIYKTLNEEAYELYQKFISSMKTDEKKKIKNLHE